MHRYVKWLLPLAVCVGIAPFTPTIDLAIARYFYSGQGHFYESSFTHFLYRYGEWAGFVCGGIASLIFLLSFLKPRLKKWRGSALCLLLTLVLGAGVLINSVLKEHWGRPRPKQLIEFGGRHTYRPFYAPDFHTTEPQKSFPSGHVAMGFYYLSLCLVGRRMKSLPLFYLGIALTLFWGGGLFFARLAQGGHFFSDALFSILLMWEVSLMMDVITHRFHKTSPLKIDSQT